MPTVLRAEALDGEILLCNVFKWFWLIPVEASSTATVTEED